MALVIRDLGGFELEVKNAGECRGYVGTQGFKGFGRESIRAASLIRVEGFEGFCFGQRSKSSKEGLLLIFF